MIIFFVFLLFYANKFVKVNYGNLEWRQINMQNMKSLALTAVFVLFSILMQAVEVSAKATLPTTGENSSPIILIAAGLAIVAGLLLFFYKKKDNHQDK